MEFIKEKSMAKRCVNCSISKRVPGVTFNEVGICSFCQRYERSYIEELAAAAGALDEAINEAKSQHAILIEHEVVVALSGGKDSLLTS